MEELCERVNCMSPSGEAAQPTLVVCSVYASLLVVDSPINSNIVGQGARTEGIIVAGKVNLQGPGRRCAL